MFYLFHGDNIEDSLFKKKELLGKFKERKPLLHAENVDVLSLTQLRLEELIGRIGLFEPYSLVIVDSGLSEANAREIITENLDKIAQSQNVFIFFERSRLPSVLLGKLSFFAKKIYASDKAPGAKTGTLSENMFRIADFLGSRNKKGLWVEFNRLVNKGVGSEEIHSILFWQVKAMLLASNATDVKESGLALFVYSKSRRYALQWSCAELKHLLSILVKIYHDSRRGLCDMPISLEKMILGI